jgi:2-hydroxycyclohexanecarboxyl-CoA dehydrogenase
MSQPIKKVAVVTGGAQGLGAAICRFLARDGADIAIWDWKIDNAQEVVSAVEALGRKVILCKVNVASRADTMAAAKATREQLGPINILVNNAGVSPEKDFLDITEEDWDAVMDINLKGTFFCTQSVIQDMMDAQWGRIVNISSSSAQTGSPRMVHYAATKGGVIGFTKALSREVAKLGITVNNVPPGSCMTPSLQNVVDEGRFTQGFDNWVKANIPVQRMGQPEDIANAVAFLASEASSYITGHTLSVNGGRYSN